MSGRERKAKSGKIPIHSWGVCLREASPTIFVPRAGRRRTWKRERWKRSAKPSSRASWAGAPVRWLKRSGRRRSPRRKQVATIQTELEKLDGEELKLADLALKGFADSIIQKKLEPIHQRRAELQVKLRAATERLSIVADQNEAERRGEAAAARIRARLETLNDDPQELQDFFRPLVIVTIWPGDQVPEVDVRVGEALRLGGE